MLRFLRLAGASTHQRLHQPLKLGVEVCRLPALWANDIISRCSCRRSVGLDRLLLADDTLKSGRDLAFGPPLLRCDSEAAALEVVAAKYRV